MKLKIRHKLFFTLLLTSGVVAAVLFWFLQWSFDRGFLEYVRSQEVAQVDRLAVKLSRQYGKEGSWDFIEGNFSLWMSLVRESDPFFDSAANSPPPPPPPEEGKGPGYSPGRGGPEDMVFPPPSDSRIFGPRIVLFDSEKKWLAGGPPEADLREKLMAHLTFRPVKYKDGVIGYLGVFPATEPSYAADLMFVEQQKESFSVVALIMVLFSLVLTYPITSHLLRPINNLKAGTDKLIAGILRTRVPVSSADELGMLSHHFNILAKTLEDNESARRQWVVDISHELRTPLSVLRGEVEAIQDGVRSPDRQTLDGLHGEILHLERLVDDLYELSMSDVGALAYKMIETDPAGILRGALEVYEQRFTDKGTRIALQIDTNTDGHLLADPDRLQQLFTNLLENSLKYSDPPGILEITMQKANGEVQIVFDDSAPGVAPESLSRLFERLFRGDPSRTRRREGAGLGLAICKNIVEAHRGTIAAEPSPLGGLRIVVCLTGQS